ncbi:MAG TPA: type II secretion system protein [Frankiaceae bacterium]|nr:type II secretion system protein [Frankiaceae bacterium]
MRNATGRRADSGFTLIETMYAMVLFGILVGISAGPYGAYRAKQEHKGATRELVAFLRRAQVRAVSEETTYRIDIAADGRTARAFRFDGASYAADHVIKTPSKRVRYAAADFVPSIVTGAAGTPGSGTSVFFYARGSASKGTVTVVRDGTDVTYTIEVEGLTARVSYE